MIELDIPAGFFVDFGEIGFGDTNTPVGRRLAVVNKEKVAGNVRIARGTSPLDRLALFMGKGELATLSADQIEQLRVARLREL